jgi:2-keto-3-deoxy-6-phosphogluconate aldolase
VDNLAAYFAAGTAAVGVSSSLFGRQALQARDIDRLADNVRKFIACCPVT